MNGVTGRMGTNQHLIRSILAIINQGGVRIADDETIIPDVYPGRPERRQTPETVCAQQVWEVDHGPRFRSCRSSISVYFDSQTTNLRVLIRLQGY
jgi:hypothetical protein